MRFSPFIVLLFFRWAVGWLSIVLPTIQNHPPSTANQQQEQEIKELSDVRFFVGPVN